jgi:hypothetical protein
VSRVAQGVQLLRCLSISPTWCVHHVRLSHFCLPFLWALSTGGSFRQALLLGEA